MAEAFSLALMWIGGFCIGWAVRERMLRRRASDTRSTDEGPTP